MAKDRASGRELELGADDAYTSTSHALKYTFEKRRNMPNHPPFPEWRPLHRDCAPPRLWLRPRDDA